VRDIGTGEMTCQDKPTRPPHMRVISETGETNEHFTCVCRTAVTCVSRTAVHSRLGHSPVTRTKVPKRANERSPHRLKRTVPSFLPRDLDRQIATRSMRASVYHTLSTSLGLVAIMSIGCSATLCSQVVVIVKPNLECEGLAIRRET
jgi:hypothetical protein